MVEGFGGLEGIVPGTPLSSMRAGASGRVHSVVRDLTGRRERLAALGVTPGAFIRVLQTFPVIVFECDQTEIAIERAMARVVSIEPSADGNPAPGPDRPRKTEDSPPAPRLPSDRTP